MRLRRIAVVVAVIATLAAHASAQIDWKARVASSNGVEKIKNALYYAELQAKAADQAYKDGKNSDGLAELQDVAEYSKLAADTSMHLGKHEKDTEIAIRKIAKRLVDVKQNAEVDDQPAVQKIIDAVQASHDQLLDFMFKKKH